MEERDQRSIRDVPGPADREMGSGEGTGEEGRRETLAATGVHALRAGREEVSFESQLASSPDRAPFYLSRRLILSRRSCGGH